MLIKVEEKRRQQKKGEGGAEEKSAQSCTQCIYIVVTYFSETVKNDANNNTTCFVIASQFVRSLAISKLRSYHSDYRPEMRNATANASLCTQKKNTMWVLLSVAKSWRWIKNENNTNSVLFHFFSFKNILQREARKKKRKRNKKDILYNEQGFRYDKTTIISSCYDSWYLSFLAFDFHP